MKKCKRCGKKVQHLARARDIYWVICWDCLIYLDLNHKNIKKYENNA